MQSQSINLTFVQVYAPIGASFEEEITAFYEQLHGVWDNVYRQDVIVITGDWNANIGNPRAHKQPDNIGPYGLGDRNERGNLLEEFCAANELVVSNTKINTNFQQHPGRLYNNTGELFGLAR